MAHFIILNRSSYASAPDRVAINLDHVATVEPTEENGIKVVMSIPNKSGRGSMNVEFEAAESFEEFTDKVGAR